MQLLNILCKLACYTPKMLLPMVSADVIFCHNSVKYEANLVIL